MVRVNLINPKYLTDQHLVAEYLEIIMLVKYIKTHPSLENLPKNYTLGKGHMRFFKNKVKYLQLRHEKIKKEMQKRGIKTNKTLNVNSLTSSHFKNWKPSNKDLKIIKQRLKEKILKKPSFYKYYKEKRSKTFLVNLIKNAKI